MRFGLIAALLPLAPLIAAACSINGKATTDLGEVSDAYVRLVLAMGRHDAMYVDAYHGPPEWKEEAEKGNPRPVTELLREARELLARVRAAQGSERRDFLEKQLVAVEAFLRRLAGESMTLDQEARLLYDIDPSVHSVEEFEGARIRLETLLPGSGDLRARVKALRDRFIVPPERLDAVVRACLEATRKKTVESVALPAGDTFRVSFVRGKPWNAYNWYEGNYSSLIEVNTDLPIELGRIFDTLAHEGYPGHHTHNALLEERLVRAKGWREFTVYPLYSPRSLVAEGTANAGLSVILGEAEQLAFLETTLAPLAGLDGRDLETYQAVRNAMKPLRYVRGEAARLLFDGGKSDDEAARFIARYGLEDDDRARKSVEFIRGYRSYVFNYTVGEDLVRAYVGDGPGRTGRFFDLLQRPVTPSALRGDATRR